MKIEFMGKRPFLTKITCLFLDSFSNFIVEAKQLIFLTKCVVLEPKQLAKFLIKLKFCLSVLSISEVALLGYP